MPKNIAKNNISQKKQYSNKIIPKKAAKSKININKKIENKKNIRGPFTVKEDSLLIKWVEQNGPKNWKQFGLQFAPGRNDKQIREHWNNCLKPELVKGQWTAEEDFLIMYFYKKCHGSWKELTNFLVKKRCQNSIKNRFYSELRKIAKFYIKKEPKQKFKLEEILKYLDIGIRNSKKRFMVEKNFTEKEFDEYINKMIKFSKNTEKSEENEMNKSLLSIDINNISDNKDNQTNLEKETKNINIKRTKEDDSKNDLNALNKEDILELENLKNSNNSENVLLKLVNPFEQKEINNNENSNVFFYKLNNFNNKMDAQNKYEQFINSIDSSVTFNIQNDTIDSYGFYLNGNDINYLNNENGIIYRDDYSFINNQKINEIIKNNFCEP